MGDLIDGDGNIVRAKMTVEFDVTTDSYDWPKRTDDTFGATPTPKVSGLDKSFKYRHLVRKP